nr:lysophospholipid acyltransferase family protein [Aureimonas fodinaquatilis]
MDPAGRTETGHRAKTARSKKLRLRLRALGRSPKMVSLAGFTIYGVLRLLHATQRPAAGSADWRRILTQEHPAIVALWHGQHLLAPFFRPRELPYAALLSRNVDAAVNADVVERFGISTVRGSGGRVRQAVSEKGGARALIQLVRTLRQNIGVCMIADVPKGTPREAGLGIITLARMSGRPIIPSAAVTSRRRVLRKSWDKTTIPLPFGQIAVIMGEPIFVPADADAGVMEEKRREVTLAIEAANRRAIALADGVNEVRETA